MCYCLTMFYDFIHVLGLFGGNMICGNDLQLIISEHKLNPIFEYKFVCSASYIPSPTPNMSCSSPYIMPHISCIYHLLSQNWAAKPHLYHLQPGIWAAQPHIYHLLPLIWAAQPHIYHLLPLIWAAQPHIYHLLPLI